MFAKVMNSPVLLLATFVVTLTTSSIIYAIVESTSFVNAMYWSIVTATTLGYGDFSPNSTAGKVLTSVLICATVFLFIPMITANLASKLIVNRDAFTHEEQEQVKEGIAELQRTLATLVERDR